jgi:nitrate reductase NapE
MTDLSPGVKSERRREVLALLFLLGVVMPGLTVAAVGSYGLAVWIYQMIAGPPGPPGL